VGTVALAREAVCFVNPGSIDAARRGDGRAEWAVLETETGTVSFHSAGYNHARAELRARQVGFVFQSFQLLGNLTALENVMLPLELMGRPDARAAATEMLRRVGLAERLRHYPKVLSGGEQQRVALARAFVVRPAVLLADEPTGSLDFATGATVMELMFELNREAGTTLVLVTHDPAIAARCDRQLRIEAGRIVESTRRDVPAA